MESILAAFFEPELVASVESFGAGHINDTFKIVLKVDGNAQGQSFLLQRLNHQVFRQPENVMANIVQVAGWLSDSGYPLKILQPVVTRNGQFFYITPQGQYWRVFPFFERTIAFDKVKSPEMAFEGGYAFGTFIRFLSDRDPNCLHVVIPDFHNGRKRWDLFKAALKNASRERVKTAQEEIRQVQNQATLLRKIPSLRLPLRIIHHDTKISNLLFDADTYRAVSVIDLDTVMPGIILSDFGDMMRTFTNIASEDEPDVDKVAMDTVFYEALREGFLSATLEILTPSEYQYLPQSGCWITLMQAMRFLSDYLLGDVYYKIHYPLHNLVRTRNQLALLHSMRESLPDLQNF